MFPRAIITQCRSPHQRGGVKVDHLSDAQDVIESTQCHFGEISSFHNGKEYFNGIICFLCDYGIWSFEEGGIKMSVALKKAEMFSTLWIPQKQIFHLVKVLGM